MFQDRRDAGRILAHALARIPALENAVVLALPRGGVPVAFEVAQALRLPLDIFIVRKLGAPGQEELAIGAIASDGTLVINDGIAASFQLSETALQALIERERKNIAVQERAFRCGRPPLPIDGRTVILVDDGIATGATIRAAARALRSRAARIILATPVATPSTCRELESDADAVVCASTPASLEAVGLHYRDFQQTSDDAVRAFLAEAQSNWAAEHTAAPDLAG